MRREVTATMSNDRRKKISHPNRDQRVFSRTADKIHSANVVGATRVMRGGIRL